MEAGQITAITGKEFYSIIMNRQEAKDLIRQQEPFFLDKAKRTGWICPYCGNGSGATGDGIVKDAKDPSKTHYKCFVCGQYVDIIDLVGAYYGIDQNDWASKFSKAFEVYGITPQNDDFVHTDRNGQNKAFSPPADPEPEPDYTSFFKEAAASNTFEYLLGRGISEGTQRRFLIGYVPDWISPQAVQTTIDKGGDPAKLPRSPRCIIPTSRGSYIARDTRSNLNEDQQRYSKQKQGKQHLFNLKALESDVVFVTEGEIDALSIEEAGGRAVGLGSASMIRSFLAEIQKNYTGQVFVLCLDNDEPGQLAQKQLAEHLANIDIKFIDGAPIMHGRFKDPNESLCADPEAFRTAASSLQAEAQRLAQAGAMKEYRAADLLDYFRTIEDQPEGMEAQTGFKELDKKLQGGLHEGLYIIGAVSSLGKTTFTLQIADQIAARGQDVLFFSLEMSKTELMAKSISRFTYIGTGKRKDHTGSYIARDTAQVMNSRRYKNFTPEERQSVREAIQLYQPSAEHLYIYEGRYQGQRLTVGHIKEITKKHAEQTGNTPIVFIDYLQIIAPADVRASDKQNTDTAVFELKELSRDLKTAVFAISSFNRDNYTEPVNMASFKESGAVEYSSDVLFGLQYAGMDYQPGETENRRKERLRDLTKQNFSRKEQKEQIQIELKCLKNRNGYQFTVCFEMQAAFNYFEESHTGTNGADRFQSRQAKPVI